MLHKLMIAIAILPICGAIVTTVYFGRMYLNSNSPSFNNTAPGDQAGGDGYGGGLVL